MGATSERHTRMPFGVSRHVGLATGALAHMSLTAHDYRCIIRHDYRSIPTPYIPAHALLALSERLACLRWSTNDGTVYEPCSRIRVCYSCTHPRCWLA